MLIGLYDEGELVSWWSSVSWGLGGTEGIGEWVWGSGLWRIGQWGVEDDEAFGEVGCE